MKGIYRNLRFWGRNYEYMLGWGILMLIGIAVFSCLIAGDLKEIPAALANVGTTYIYIPTFFILMGMNGADTYFPFSVSMGSSRRDSFIGMEIMLHVIGLELLLLIFILGSLSGSSLSEVVPAMIAYMFLGLLVNNLLCAIVFRFGRKAAVGAYFAIFFTVVMIILIPTLLFEISIVREVQFFMRKNLSLQAWIFIGIAAAILLDAFSILLQWISIRKVEVRV